MPSFCLPRNQFPYLLRRQQVQFKLVDPPGQLLPTAYLKEKPPYDVVIHKGSNQAVLSRAFAQFLLTSPVVRDLMAWFSDTFCPDEYVWPTINHNPQLHASGGYIGKLRVKKSQRNFFFDFWNCFVSFALVSLCFQQ